MNFSSFSPAEFLCSSIKINQYMEIQPALLVANLQFPYGLPAQLLFLESAVAVAAQSAEISSNMFVKCPTLTTRQKLLGKLV